MKRRTFVGATMAAAAGAAVAAPGEVQPGVWRFRFGTPEKITPVSTRHYPAAPFDGMPAAGACPRVVTGSGSRRGYLVNIPLEPNEMVYGLGLMLQSFIQRGLKKKLRVNADPKIDSGDSHAPVPFYVTTRGYGVLIDTARYATFYCGNKKKKGVQSAAAAPGAGINDATALPAAYGRYRLKESSEVLVEIPEAEGVDVYVFGGPTMREAVQRYNLFSGGGALPPRWGLGMWYRCEKGFAQDEVLKIADEFRKRKMPFDVIGLEPGWQSNAYSCSFVWSKKFPDPKAMIGKLDQSHYKLNLWEHAFTNPASPIHKPLLQHSGDYEVWGGVVPDFLDPAARKIFADFHEREHVSLGVSGYKLDECDNSDLTGNWSFPEIAQFPSGADGEQMHCLFGLRYQDTIQGIFDRRRQRTYGLVRSSHALAAPYPYVLYSDLYDHSEFIKAVAKMGLSGLLWTPELRNAQDTEDLIRRLQAVALSPLAMVDAWYIKNPPWKQVDRRRNNEGEFDPNWEDVEKRCRAVMEMRMQFVPYLHAAFVRYQKTGLPPFRPLVMDWPSDVQTWGVDTQYMMGEGVMAAPVTAGQHERDVYLPEGDWFDFWSGKRYAGKQRIRVAVPLEQIPIFVKGGTLLPLAQPTLHTEEDGAFALSVKTYGQGPASCSVFEEEGLSLREVKLSWDGSRATITGARRYRLA